MIKIKANPTPNYKQPDLNNLKLGDTFSRPGTYVIYMLAQVDPARVVLVSLSNGNRYTDPVTCSLRAGGILSKPQPSLFGDLGPEAFHYVELSAEVTPVLEPLSA